MTDDDLLHILHEAASAVTGVLDGLEDWGLAGTVEGQYRHDLAADAAAVEVLVAAGLGVVSEESGAHRPDRALVVVLDPVDGSTNASRGIPWYNTSLCALDADGARAALVVNQISGERYQALRGGGATRDGQPLKPSACTELASAVVGLNGYPTGHLGWKQFRALGSAALDLCLVASGVLDAYVDCTTDGHAPWDYLGGMLICTESGAVVADVGGRNLTTSEHGERRSPAAAATPELLDAVVTALAATPSRNSVDG